MLGKTHKPSPMTHHFYRWYVLPFPVMGITVADRQGNGRRNSQRSVWTDGSMEEWRENMSYVCVYIYIPVVPARGGAEVALKIYIRAFSSIELACAVRQPSPWRACTLRNWCLVSHVAFEVPRHTSHLTVFTLHTALFTLHPSQSTLHFTLYP